MYNLQKLLDFGNYILNFGKSSSLDPLPVIFFPLSSNKIYGKMEINHVLNYFAMPLVTEIEQFYIKEVEIEYAYNLKLISSVL
jgi:hypothetical protein